jgi:hypothetical protein
MECFVGVGVRSGAVIGGCGRLGIRDLGCLGVWFWLRGGYRRAEVVGLPVGGGLAGQLRA